MTTTSPSRRGLSYIEVMISIAILVTALAALVGSLFQLNLNHRTNQEVARVSEIVDTVVERIQGINWNRLGSDEVSWSWLRRGPISQGIPLIDPDDPTSVNQVVAGVNPPMTESAADRRHNLMVYDPRTDDTDPTNDNDPVTGLLHEPSGVRDLRIWVEYRRMGSVENVASQSAWNAKLATVANLVDPSNDDPAVIAVNRFDPTVFDEALLVRVIARWSSVSGGERQYEINFSRRR